jgi:hypothetical protein
MAEGRKLFEMVKVTANLKFLSSKTSLVSKDETVNTATVKDAVYEKIKV